MKIITTANGKIKGICKTSAYKVRYKQRGEPGEQSKIVGIDSAEKAIKYIKYFIGNNVEILGVDEVSRMGYATEEKKQRRTPPRSFQQKSPNKERVRTKVAPTMPIQNSGYMIEYDQNWMKAGKNPEIARFPDASSAEEALEMFKEEIVSEYPKAKPINRPKRMDSRPGPMSFDENGRPTDPEKRKNWWAQMKMHNRPR